MAVLLSWRILGTEPPQTGIALTVSRNRTERFSNRVEHHVRYRPGYPPAWTAYLRQHRILRASSIPTHARKRAALRALFDTCAIEGKITLGHDTRLYFGRMN